MAVQNATLSSETVRQVSVRPSWKRRVAADYLNVGVGGALELLHHALAVALVGFNAEIVLGHELDVV
jgi:hypothetical protein